MEIKFYRCSHCGNIITYMVDKGVPVMCCGEKMEELLPGTVDAALEKHVPVIVSDGNKVTVEVGSVTHPMTEEHFIQWIVLQTSEAIHCKKLTPSSTPKATFALADGEKVDAAYEYCNLHGLWKA